MSLVSNCCNAHYIHQAWGDSITRRCTKCSKRCTPIEYVDVEEELEIHTN